VFSATGVQDPAAVVQSLIPLAGDIESNPRPITKYRNCKFSKKAIHM